MKKKVSILVDYAEFNTIQCALRLYCSNVYGGLKAVDCPQERLDQLMNELLSTHLLYSFNNLEKELFKNENK